MSLYSVVSRGVAGRFGQNPADKGAAAKLAETTSPGVRLPGASMRVIETGLALFALVTAIVIGVGR